MLTRKPNHFQRRFAFSSIMEGVCSAQVQAQNKHSRGLKGRPSILPATFADTIHKSIYILLVRLQRQQQGDAKDEAAGRAVRLR